MPGLWPKGVVDLVLMLVLGFGSRDVYIPPPFPVGPGVPHDGDQWWSEHFWAVFLSIFWGIDFRLIFWYDFPSILTFSWLALQVLFSCLNMFLKVIFASSSEPANLDFEATLQHFLRFFRFSQDRVENDFEVIFELPKASKNT